jgi:hypothetical protein
VSTVGAGTTVVNPTAVDATSINVVNPAAACWQAGVWVCRGPLQPR